MKKSYNRHNFFKHTFCQWKIVDISFISDREPDYKSKSGSSYYFDKEGLFRYSNHWGRAANCRWRLLSDHEIKNGWHLAYAKWADFYPNNDKESLYFIEVDWQNKTATFQHRYSNPDFHLYRSAIETAKRIQLIKEVFETIAWAKYLDYISIDDIRAYFINALKDTNLSFIEIKKSWSIKSI